jgi:hypothetical protein
LEPAFQGIVERICGLLENSSLLGLSFAAPLQLNTQLVGWLPTANARKTRSINAQAVDVIGLDRVGMVPLPPVAPTQLTSVRDL